MLRLTKALPSAGLLALLSSCAAIEEDAPPTLELELQGSANDAAPLPFDCATSARPAGSLDDLANGQVLACTPLPPSPQLPGYKRYSLEYKTTIVVQESPPRALGVAVTGELYVPNDDALVAAGGSSSAPEQRAVLAVPHGLTGMQTPCGPSVSGRPFTDSGNALQLARGLDAKRRGDLTNARTAFVVPDLMGLGIASGLWSSERTLQVNDPLVFYPPKKLSPLKLISHSFVSLPSAGHATIDMVRAAASVREAGVPDNPSWFAFGQSQGGHAALAAGELHAAGYAGSATRLLGVIAGAPASELDYRDDQNQYVRPIVQSMTVIGLSLEWPALKPSRYITNAGLAAFAHTLGSPSAGEACVGSTANQAIGTYAQYTALAGAAIRSAAYNDPVLLAALHANSPGRHESSVPIFIGQVEGDPFIGKGRTDRLVASARKLDDQVDAGAPTPGDLGVTYCVYAPLEPPASDPRQWTNVAAWFGLLAQNHKPFVRMFADPATLVSQKQVRSCKAPGDKPIAVSADENTRKLWHPVDWAAAIFEKSL